MIHTMRENETSRELVQIFSCEETDIFSVSGKQADSLTEGMSVWIGLGYIPHFDKKNFALTKKPLFSHEELKLSCIYTPQSNEESFVGADILAQNASFVYIDAYNITENLLNLPYDYPAINACIMSKHSPAFVINEPSLYAKENILEQLLHDLSFKEYTRCLINVPSYKDIQAFNILKESLNSAAIAVEVAAPHRVFSEASGDIAAEKYFYRPERNVLDFESFTNNVSHIAELFGASKTGCVVHPSAARINKESGKVEFLCAEEVQEAIASHVDKISFDEASQLAHCTYSDDKGSYSLIFEDYRTLCAKISFLLKSKITDILTQQENYLNAVKNIVSLIE